MQKRRKVELHALDGRGVFEEFFQRLRHNGQGDRKPQNRAERKHAEGSEIIFQIDEKVFQSLSDHDFCFLKLR